MKKEAFILSLIFVLCCSFQAIGETYFVDNDAPYDPEPNNLLISDPNENGSPEHPFDGIQEAIAIALDEDTVTVLEGIYWENITISDKKVTLTTPDPNETCASANTIIDGRQLGSVVTVTDSNSIISGFMITNGLAENGGGIDCRHSGLEIHHCLITNNKTIDGIDSELEAGDGGDGAGIYCLDSEILMEGCEVKLNRTGNGGNIFGEIHNWDDPCGDGGFGSGVYCSSTSLTLSDCTIADNIAGNGGAINSWYGFGGDGGNGGGIYCTDSSTLIITSSSLTGNHSGTGGFGDESGGRGGHGAGIYLSSASTMTILDSEVSSNSTGPGGDFDDSASSRDDAYGGYGGGIYVSSASSASVRCCEIIGNATGSGGSDPHTWDVCSKGGNGAGLFCDASSLRLEESIVGNNWTGYGGSGHIGSGDSGDGGGIYCSDSSPEIRFCSIIGNGTKDGIQESSSGNGAGIYCDSASAPEITDCIITENVTGDGIGYYYRYLDGGDGGGVFCTSALVQNCMIVNNYTGKGADGGYDFGGSGGAGGRGAGIFCISSSVFNCTIQYNETGSGGLGITDARGGDGGNGGGVWCESTTIADSTVTYNSTGSGGDPTDYGLGGSGGKGGGIYCHLSNITNSSISNNTTGDGAVGGDYGDAGHSPGGNGGNGGGVYCASTTLTRCLLNNNITGSGGDGGSEIGSPQAGGNGGNGGGIHCTGSVLINNTITNNQTGVEGEGGDGGADGTPGQGGGIYTDTNTSVVNSILWGNSNDSLYGYDCGNISFCDIEGAICSGLNNNISLDPLFTDPNNGDFHLKSQAGRWDLSSQSWVCDDVTSPCIDAGSPADPNWINELWPNGGRINMGAYGGTTQASMSTSNAGLKTDVNGDSRVDMGDFAVISSEWSGSNPYQIPHGDISVDGNLNDWSKLASWIPLDKFYYGSPDDIASARFSLAWNEESNKIYAAVVVNDSEHVFSDDFSGSWDASDRLEIHCQGDAQGGEGWYLIYDEAQKYCLGPDTTGGAWCSWPQGQPVDPDAGFGYAVSVKGDTIIYEFEVTPFDYYGGLVDGEIIETDLQAGHVIGFDIIALTRFSTSGCGMLSENLMLQKYRNADHFARYTLADKSFSPAEIPSRCDFDLNNIVNLDDFLYFVDEWLFDQTGE